MNLPREVPVMTLPNATLFPQTLLPLYIFEPRYRQMLKDTLAGGRMFCVAMQKLGRKRETPSPIAGLGLIRAAVGHDDGTSHLILQGLARVQLTEAVRYKPYRVQCIRPLESLPSNEVVVDALLARVRELLDKRVKQGLASPALDAPETKVMGSPAAFSPKEVLEYVDRLKDPEQVADLVSCAVLPGSVERQTILETVQLEARLRHLIHFLMAEITRQGKDSNP